MNNQESSTQSQGSKTIELTEKSLFYLQKTRKWGLFFSVLGFVVIGLLFLAMLIIGSSVSFMPHIFPFYGRLMFTIYTIVIVLYFFPTLYLYQFSKNTRLAIAQRSSNLAELAFKNLKSMFTFLGVLTIIIISIYIAIIFIGFFAALSMKMQF